MQRFGQFIVRFRIPIVILSFLLAIPAAFGYFNTRINYDIMSYLPEDLETMVGQDILLDEFGKGGYAIFVCEGMEQKDVSALKEKLEDVDHVDSIVWYDTLMDTTVPVEALPDEIRDVFYSEDGDSTLMFIFFDTSTSDDATIAAIKEIRSIANEQCFMSSMTCFVTDMQDLLNKEMAWYVIIAVVLVSLVMACTMDSFLVPVIIMLNIGLSIIYNLGTNFIQGEISFLTQSLVAILQLAVTMDYSIFLYSSYKEFKELGNEPGEAMTQAIAATINSISASSLTTIAGFIALCFMSFTLGMDMGVVMTKGVILGVITCVTILPSLILIMDKPIMRTAHRPIALPTEGLCGFIGKHHRIIAVVLLLLWIPALYGYSNNEVYYRLSHSLPEDTGCVQGDEALEKFEMGSLSMILVDKDLSHDDTVEMLNAIKQVDGVNFALGLDSVVGSLMPDELVPQEAKDILETENWKLILYSSAYETATDEVNAQCNTVSEIINAYDPNGMLIGEPAATKDLVEVTDHDFAVVNSVSIGCVFVLILFSTGSLSLPVLLVMLIELAIYINMGASSYLGQTLPFIAEVFVSTIQLGATVDYAILMTNRYKRERISGQSRDESVRIALSTSVESIMTSAIGFFGATVGVSVISSADLIGSIVMLLARGALISMFMVIMLLPCLLLIFDKIICRTTLGMRSCIHQ